MTTRIRDEDGIEEAESVPAGMSVAEWEVRCNLAACYQLTDLYGMSDFAGTHISARVPGPEDHFLLNPFGTLFDQITASSLIKVDVNGNVVEGDAGQLNYAGFVIHSAIHMARRDLVCVVHTHTVANNGVGMQKDGLLPITQKALLMWYSLRYHDFEGAATDLAERDRILDDLGPDGRCMLLRNHGALTVGQSIAEAFSWMCTLEMACRYQIAGLSGNRELNWLSDKTVEHTIEQGRSWRSPGGSSVPGREWPSLLRKLERERGFSYRT